MPRVLNLETGVEHDVPEGHWSLSSDEYRVLPERGTEPVKPPTPKPTSKPKGK